MSIRPFKVLTTVFSTVALVCFSGGVNGFPAYAQTGARLKIVAATSLIAEIVHELGGDTVEVASPIPPASGINRNKSLRGLD